MLATEKLSPDLWDLGSRTGRADLHVGFQPCRTAKQMVFDKAQPVPELMNPSVTSKSIGSISPDMNSRKHIWLIEPHRRSKSMTACKWEGGKAVYR